jgi:hypothetical protein
MAPFKMFSGIDEGAAAIRDFSAVADRFARRVDQIPQETAWELQLILHDTENGAAAQRTLTSLEEFSAASTSVAATAKDFPGEVRRTVDAAFASLDERHARLDASIRSAEAVMARAEEALRSAEKPLADAAATAKGIGEAGESWKGTIDAYHAMVADLYPPKDAAAPAERPGRPFDIREYERTAVELAGTARELRGTIDSLRGLLKEADTDATADRLARVARDSAAAARAEGEALADHVFVRALQFAAAATGLAAAAVLLLRRRSPKA